MGNIFGKWQGSDASLGSVLAGSHCDAIPLAGMYDGTLGVIGAIEALAALKRAVSSSKHMGQAGASSRASGGSFDEAAVRRDTLTDDSKECCYTHAACYLLVHICVGRQHAAWCDGNAAGSWESDMTQTWVYCTLFRLLLCNSGLAVGARVCTDHSPCQAPSQPDHMSGERCPGCRLCAMHGRTT